MHFMVPEHVNLRGRTVTTGGVAAFVIGLLGLAAWTPSWLGLGVSRPELMTMAPLTGVGLVALGGSLLRESRWPLARRTTALALLISVVALGRLGAFWAGLPDWPDDWLIPTRLSHRGVVLGHISPLTSLAFLLGAVALAGISAQSLRRALSDVSGVLACLLSALTLVVLLGYSFGTPLLYGGSVVPMALPTAIAFACLGAGLIALSGSQRLPLRPLIGTSVEARLLRGILPMLSAVVVAECLLFRFGGGLNPALRAAVASMVVATVVIAGGLRLARRVGRVVDEAEFERGQAARKLSESEERLRNSEELFRSAFACATEGVCLVATDGRFLRVNPALCEMLGYTAEELEQRCFNDITYEEDKGLGAAMAAQLASGTPGRMRFEKRYVHKEGHVIWAQVATALVPQQGSHQQYFITHVQEISERLKAKRALEASEALLRQFIKHTPAAVAMFDTEMRYLQASDRWLTDYHLDGEAIVGRGHYEIFPDLPDRWKEAHQRVLAGSVERCVEDAFTRSNGSTEWLQWEARPWLKADGAVGGVAMFTQVITDRKRAQEERVLLSQAIEQSAESVMITDPQGSIVYVNPAFEQLTGYTRTEVLGQNPRILKGGSQNAEFYQGMWTTLLRGKTWTGHLTNRRKDGTPLEEDAVISPVRDASGRLVNYVAVKRDVTQVKSLEQQLRQAQKMEAVGRLAGGVAHDFNNMLGVILGYGETVARRLPPEDPLRDKVHQILRAAGRAADLTRQLLAFSRKQILQPRALDLNEVVGGMEKMLRRLIGEDIALATKFRPELGIVKADPGQIEQVLMNLVVNARDAIGDSGGHVTIETTNADFDRPVAHSQAKLPAGRYVVLAVSDDGTGMSSETEAHIFEPFFTTKPAGKGTGLGLSTVYGIVKQSEGYVWVYSELGRGTTFKIYLPRIDEQAVADREATAAAVPRGTETLLLVEDDPALRDLLRDVLEENGYTVLAAPDGTLALEAARGHAGRIDLLVTDVVMPGLTGPKVAQQFTQARPEARVIYLSGYSEEAVATLGQLGPGAVLLSKPFAADMLLRTIHNTLRPQATA